MLFFILLLNSSSRALHFISLFSFQQNFKFLILILLHIKRKSNLANANMVNAYLIVSAIIAIIAVALGAAYTSGALDPVIEQIGIFLFKAKAEAEKKKLQAQGMKEGEDFVSGEFGWQSVFLCPVRIG